MSEKIMKWTPKHRLASGMIVCNKMCDECGHWLRVNYLDDQGFKSRCMGCRKMKIYLWQSETEEFLVML